MYYSELVTVNHVFGPVTGCETLGKSFSSVWTSNPYVSLKLSFAYIIGCMHIGAPLEGLRAMSSHEQFI